MIPLDKVNLDTNQDSPSLAMRAAVYRPGLGLLLLRQTNVSRFNLVHLHCCRCSVSRLYTTSRRPRVWSDVSSIVLGCERALLVICVGFDVGAMFQSAVRL